MVRVMIRFQVKPRTNAVFDECWLRRIRGLAVLGVLAVLAEECRPVAEASLWPSTTSSTASSGLPFGDEKQANLKQAKARRGHVASFGFLLTGKGRLSQHDFATACVSY